DARDAPPALVVFESWLVARAAEAAGQA
ncbi:MAG: hypothetical protein JWP29_4775, partial [Rhodoferax sp.]|nr:hypothetical protein [Rhodoferax sp.]